ncbi:MAG: MucR family transcriptional regulator [Rhizobiaceae bacterium]
MRNEEIDDRHLLVMETTADVVCSFLNKNPIHVTELQTLIENVFNTLQGLDATQGGVAPTNLRPPVPIKKSIGQDYLICLEDGKKFKPLKRHLQSRYNMTPEEYRAKWGLPMDYPMVAPGYAEKRSALAKKMGLGKRKDS